MDLMNENERNTAARFTGKILNGCWPAPEMVVEGICVEDIFQFVSLVISLIGPIYPRHLGF